MISILAIVIYNKGIYDVIEQQYKESSIEIANLVATNIDTERLARERKAVLDIYDHVEDKVTSEFWGEPEFDAYVAQFEHISQTEDYQALLMDLRRMQAAVDVNCLYIVWVDQKQCGYVYLIDADVEDPCPVGTIDPYFAAPEDYQNLEDGIAPTISNTEEYGWLLATGMPIRDETGEIIAVAGVDISMNEVMSQQNRFMAYVVLAFAGMTFFVCLLGIYMVDRTIVRPINILSKAAAQYAQNRKVFSELNMNRNDEIGMLAESMQHMEEDINHYVDNLEKVTGDLMAAQQHAQQMDLAANIDALTKVRNKRAYDLEAMRLDESTESYGIIMIDMNGLKTINDTYGHEKGDVSIKNLCQYICRVFKHSPVFRVGGDEFIVVLEHTDFMDREVLIETLREEFRKSTDDATLEPWEKVSAAVGYAVYDPETDSNANSVLKRADAAMYENKRQFKDAR